MSKILDIIKTDSFFKLTAYRGKDVWLGKCIQCNRKLYVSSNGIPISEATIEHILPKNHGGTDDLKNLAISCKNCNNFKGRTLDNQKRGHPTLEKVIASLLSKRMARWQENT
jgi:5-methylcytosine-specific restriction endonuclease McrA